MPFARQVQRRSTSNPSVMADVAKRVAREVVAAAMQAARELAAMQAAAREHLDASSAAHQRSSVPVRTS